jgi:hypothetical protein
MAKVVAYNSAGNLFSDIVAVESREQLVCDDAEIGERNEGNNHHY